MNSGGFCKETNRIKFLPVMSEHFQTLFLVTESIGGSVCGFLKTFSFSFFDETLVNGSVDVSCSASVI